MNIIKKHFDNYVNTVVLPTDSKALKLKKSSLIIVPLIIGPAALLWGILYIFLGQYLSASIPLSYSVISLFNLWHLYKTKNIILLQITLNIFIFSLLMLKIWGTKLVIRRYQKLADITENVNGRHQVRKILNLDIAKSSLPCGQLLDRHW